MAKLITAAFYQRNAARIAGFAAGAIVTLAMGAVGTVLATGHGLSDARTIEQVYIIE